MPPLAGPYLFLLGLAGGFSILAISAYRRVSPKWLRWMLIVTGCFMISRYVTMALFTDSDAPNRYWALRHCWFASSISLTLPGVFAVDQLVKHPAMTPKRLLQWFSPFAAVYASIILFGDVTPKADAIAGWMPTLSSGWRLLVTATQSVFVLGFLGLSVMFLPKLPDRRLKRALVLLTAGFAYLGLDGGLLALGLNYFRPFLFSEMLTLFALWNAFETASSIQQISL